MSILEDLNANKYAQSVASDMESKATTTAKDAELDPKFTASLDELANFMVHRAH